MKCKHCGAPLRNFYGEVRTFDRPEGPIGPASWHRTCPQNLQDNGTPHPTDGIREGPHETDRSTCEIQWISEESKWQPTPDDNPPVGEVRVQHYSLKPGTERGFTIPGDKSAWIPICAEHKARYDRDKLHTNKDGLPQWEFRPL